MGNGNKITIDEDPWISRIGNPRPLITKDQLKGQMVKSLLDDNNLWREDLMKQSFLPQDSEDILNIPTGDNNTTDEIFWSPDRKGLFSIKSIYHLAIETRDIHEGSQSDKNKMNTFWKSIWDSGVLPKIKIYLWKIINNVIPTNANILQKGVDLNPLCFFSQKEFETTSHIIWGCKVSKRIWESFIPNSLIIFNLCRMNGQLKLFGVG